MTKKSEDAPERVTLQLLKRQVDAMEDHMMLHVETSLGAIEERLAALEPKKKPAEPKDDSK